MCAVCATQGLDLAVMESGGDRLRRQVRRAVLEVVSDDCAPLYDGQPKCSEVVRRMQDLGFRPIQPVRCTPIGRRKMHAPDRPHRRGGVCELNILFLGPGVPIPPAPARPHFKPTMRIASTSTNEIANLDLWGYHDLKHNGCEGYYPASNELNASAFPAGAVVLRSNGLYYSSDWPTPFSFAFGRPYLCSDALRVRRYF